MKKKVLFIALCGALLMGCGVNKEIETQSSQMQEEKQMEYSTISMDEAKAIFEKGGDYVILDVRRADEFAAGHIPGAINIANETIGEEVLGELPDLSQTIYVYCRSGNRSKQAASKMIKAGYSHIIEFGGILDWTGEIEK